jgi:hypothetical protein
MIHGDCLEYLKQMPDDHFDSLVTDPPAGISFMGKDWDSDKGGRDGWVKWMTEVMTEVKRVLKPGAHGLVWAIPRTSHWTATALENAGFEVRDVVTHLFGSGFPKSMDISKAIDKAAGAERECTKDGEPKPTPGVFDNRNSSERPRFDLPSTDTAKQWHGWGTALKPASEHWILVRKPCSEKTVAANVVKHGTGGINIDASRIATTDNLNGGAYSPGDRDRSESAWGGGIGGGVMTGAKNAFTQPQGRFPANLVLSHSVYCTDDQCDIECAIQLLDEQSGVSKSTKGSPPTKSRSWKNCSTEGITHNGFGDSGGASRFFYCAKISPSERNAGLNGMPKVNANVGDQRPSGNMSQRLHGKENRPDVGRQNAHPTVKPKKLMSYFIRMITPPGGTVLDPFMGSGSTGVAAKECGFKFVGIEQDKEYFLIAQKRIEAVQ